MKQEDTKQLLIRDLCARLPYGVKIQCGRENATLKSLSVLNNKIELIDINHSYSIDYVKPYLFPMSSMTEEQENEYDNILGGYNIHCSESYDWLNEHHFDYRGLIDKSLAIDATNLNIYG